MNNTPYLYWWYSVVLAAIIIMIVVATAVDLVTSEKDSGGFWIAALPFMVIWVLELVAILGLGWWVLRLVQKWNTTAMVVSAFVTPFVSIYFIIRASEVLGIPINTIGNHAPFYLIAGLVVVSGVILYNDLKYRKPHLRSRV